MFNNSTKREKRLSYSITNLERKSAYAKKSDAFIKDTALSVFTI